MKEEWRAIKGFSGWCEVSSLGRVRRLVDRKRNRLKEPRMVPFEKWRRGYLRVTFYHEGRDYHFSVSRLVLEAFSPNPLKDKLHAAHLNGDITDNRLANLAWCTAKENNSHKKIHGTAQVGSKHPMSKLTEKDVPKIFELRKTGSSVIEIARLFGVSTHPIYQILKGKNWTHVSR